MSFLAWAFAIGSLAVGFPLLFHLIRKTPRGRQEFSSIMFLKSSPPRITRRSRLDNLLLLLLRMAVIVLLAIAFMRPFFRGNVNLGFENLAARRIAILVDVSASMQREDLWKQAADQVDSVLSETKLSDDVALFTFAESTRTVVDFATEAGDGQRAEKPDLIRSEMREVSPCWEATDLGRALTTVAEALTSVDDGQQASDLLQIILISDLQSGASIEALQAYQWPAAVQVDVRQLAPADRSNGSVRLLEAGDAAAPDAPFRVRVANSKDSEVDQFYVSWSGGPGEESGMDASGEVPFFVPSGTSRVLSLPRTERARSADRLLVRGDTADFDNTFFVSPTDKIEQNVLFVGPDDPEDAEGLLYYLRHAFVETASRTVSVRGVTSLETENLLGDDAPDLVVVGQVLSSEDADRLRDYVDDSGMIFVVLQEAQQLPTLQPFFGAVTLVKEEPSAAGASASDPTSPANRRDDYALLADIDFSHPLFATFATTRYNDFTKIHFWRFLSVTLDPAVETTRVLARFDNGAPAMWNASVGRGEAYCLTSGWQPSSSQLALSSKFVPLLNVLLDISKGTLDLQLTGQVNQPISIPSTSTDDVFVIRPDGSRDPLASGASQYAATDQPGLYEVSAGDRSFTVAVNVSASESLTGPLALEKLQMHNVPLGLQPTQLEQAERLKRAKDTELESQQKVWKWLIAAAFVFLIAETWLAGRTVPAASASGEVATTPVPLEAQAG